MRNQLVYFHQQMKNTLLLPSTNIIKTHLKFSQIAEERVFKFVDDSIQFQIDDRQYSSQKGVSTTHCLIDVYHQLLSEAEKSDTISTLIFTDFLKDFDVTDHNIAFFP